VNRRSEATWAGSRPLLLLLLLLRRRRRRRLGRCLQIYADVVRPLLLPTALLRR
jgi:hypothetical protein